MFCQFEVLRRCLPARIQQVLEELPESLDGTYERILQDIDKANFQFARRLFQCVAVASRPLRAEELAELLAFDFDSEPAPSFRVDWRPEDPIDAVLSTCSSLLAVAKLGDLTFIEFSHFSVREFLTSARLAGAEDTISHYHVSMTPAHTIMAQACLGILLHLDEQITDDSLKDFPLAEYAAKHWVDHARFENVSANTHDGMTRLFDPRRPHLTIMVWIYDPEIPWWTRSERPSQPKGTCLHYAALWGLHPLVQYLVAKLSPDLNARGFFDEVTALHLASRDGYVEVVRVLLENGADANARDISKWTPLRRALDEGHSHVEVARVLIEHGADVSAQGVDDWMPLHWAARRGQAHLVQVLVEHGADITAKDVYGWTPWHRASDEGHVEVIQVLLPHMLAVASPRMDMSTPLRAAPRGEMVGFMRTILKSSSYASVLKENSSILFHWALRGGLAFLKHSADTRAQDKLTPLHLASRDGYVVVALALLEHGADARAQDDDGSTPLHLASRGGHVEVALALLKHGAGASAQDKAGSTPLHLALQRKHVVVALALLEHGADARAQDKVGSTPLHLASRDGHVEVALALLMHGADASAQDKAGSTSLYLALQDEHVVVALALLEHGADARAQDKVGSTPLHLASRSGHVELALALLEHGADANAQDKDKSTPLHLASGGGHVELALALLEHGADANARDKDKSTPWDLAARGGHMEVVHALPHALPYPYSPWFTSFEGVWGWRARLEREDSELSPSISEERNNEELPFHEDSWE